MSAVGTVKGIRHSHGEDLAEYIRQAGSGEGVALQREILPAPVRAWEKVMLGLRTREGVEESAIEPYLRGPATAQGERFGRLLKEGFLLLSNGRYQVSPKGYFVLNGILGTLAA